MRKSAKTTQALPELAVLWIGGALSWIEQLSLLSFLRVGHSVTLYTYGTIEQVPDGVTVVDANDIYTPPEGLLEKTAPAYIADLFRIHLMGKTNQVWMDTDLIAVKPITVNDDGFAVGWEEPNAFANNAVMRLPKDSGSLKIMLEAATDVGCIPPWMRPVHQNELRKLPAEERFVERFKMLRAVMGPRALSHALKHSDEAHHVLPMEVFYPVPWPHADLMFNPHGGMTGWLTDDTVAVHLWNSMLRRYFKRRNPHPNSFMGQQLTLCELKFPEKS